MNRPKKKMKLPDLSALNEGQIKELDDIKDKLWKRIDELMNGEGYESEEKFNFKMQTWVEYEARTRPTAARELVLIGAQLIQRRFYTVIAAAIRSDSGEVIDPEAKIIPFELPDNKEGGSGNEK
jgi:hypothetical protein